MRDATRRCCSRAWVGAPFDVRSRLRLGGHACVPRLCESTEEDPVAAGEREFKNRARPTARSYTETNNASLVT